jgi:hypothetical protein
VAASKRVYGDRGLAVANSFGRTYVEFATPSSAGKLARYGRRVLAKDAGVSSHGPGSDRLMKPCGSCNLRLARSRRRCSSLGAGRTAVGRLLAP